MTDNVTNLADRRKHTGLDLGTCGAFLPDGGLCQGRITVLDEIGGILEGECTLCRCQAALPVGKADPSVRKQLLLDAAGIPRQFASRRFEENAENRPALELLRSWLACYVPSEDRADRLASLLKAPAIWGLQGRGKTHLLAATCRMLIDRCHVRVLFRSSAGLLDELQQAFDRPAEERDLWHQFTTVDVLALDDIGAEQATDWRRDRIARIVDARYQDELPIIAATNFPPSQWEDLLDARTVSRLSAMTFPVELRGVDRRTQTTSEGSTHG